MSNIELLQECKLQLEYLNQKFTSTGTANSLLAKIEAALQNKVSDISAEEIELEAQRRYAILEKYNNLDGFMKREAFKNGAEWYASIVNERKDNIPADFKQITGHDSPEEMAAYEKGREDEQEVIMKWIEKWDGSSNSVMGATLKKVLKKFERKDSADIEEKLKLECRRIKIQRNEYEQELIRTRRKVSRLNAIIKSQPKQKEVDDWQQSIKP